MRPDLFGEPVWAQLYGIPITRTMLTSVMLSALLIALGALIARAVERAPFGRVAAVGRIALRALQNLVEQSAGERTAALETFAGTLFLFIAGAAVLGQLPGVTAPTANLSVASALAVLVFVAVPVAGVRAHGIRGHIAQYFKPNPLMFPLHVISDLSRTLALALRLFGNMMSGHLVVGLLVALAGLFVPIPLMALDLLIGLLQAYIFTILASVYLGAAIRMEQGA